MERYVLTALAALLFLTGCGQEEAKITRFEGFALGTTYMISVKGDVPAGLQPKIDSVFTAANNSMSVFNPGSLLSRLNRNETDEVDENIAYCLELARKVSEFSGGMYDITTQPLSEAYGFRKEEQVEDVNVDSLLRFVGYRKIEVRDGRLIKQYPETRIDLNSVAKGHTVDLQARLLESLGVTDYLVYVGGEIFCRGTNTKGKDWVVGIETPYEGNFIQGEHTEALIAVSGKGVATSGNYRNFHTDSRGRKFTHIINPLTGENTESNLLSATVIAESCALADAFGTMFITLGLEGAMEKLEENPEMAVMLIYTDDGGGMKIHYTDAMRPYIVNN